MPYDSCILSKRNQPPGTPGQLANLGTGENQFSIQSNNITKTDDGLKFTGSIKGKNNQGLDFEIGEGDFDVKTGPGDVITSFKGIGIPKFPNIGLFAELQKTFLWTALKSHIEYETGKYYKENYKTDIPLTDDRKYLHFQVFDESKDGPYNLRNVANTIIYKFGDLYIDPSDPAIFFKLPLWKPDGSKSGDMIEGFWKKVAEKLKSIGSGTFEFADSPNLIFGISNQATFRSKPYKFTVSDEQKFKEQFGFDRFASLPSHLFFKLSGVPIPNAIVFQMSGEAFIHYPTSTLLSPGTYIPNFSTAYQDALDFFGRKGDHGYMVTFTGSIDPGGKGIGLMLGMLPNINTIVGKEIFNKDFNIDMGAGTLQFQIGNGRDIPSFLRFALETKVPVVSDIFGESIRKYALELPVGANTIPQAFGYFNLGPTMEDISYYVENAMRIRVPFYGDYDLLRSRIFINKDGIKLSAKHTAPLGPIILSGEITGKLSTSGYELAGIAEGNLELPGGVKLISNNLTVKLSSDSGVTLHGKTELPYGLGKAEVKGQLTTAGLTLSGKLNAGVSIDLGNGYKLPTANMEFSLSTNPAEGFRLKGNVTVPRVGMVAVEGKINSDDFLLSGKLVANQISFGSVNLPYGSGSITISKKNGVVFKGQFNLGSAFGQAEMQGKINATTIDLTGSLRSTVTIAGHNFTLANGKITANNAGVKLNGSLNLYVFSVSISGSMYGVNNFALSGTYNYNTALVKATIKVDVKPTSVSFEWNRPHLWSIRKPIVQRNTLILSGLECKNNSGLLPEFFKCSVVFESLI